MIDSITILGIDFTSAPTPRKPITCARTRFDGEVLRFDDLVRWDSFARFEAALATPGRWVAGFDFPFGQSRRLVENIGWPRYWAGYVEKVAAMGRREFRQALEEYKRDRQVGDKHHKRACDVLSRSQSPQTLNYTPVGLMFFEGAPRLCESGVHLPFHHDGDSSRIALEVYPGVAARELIGNISYKSDTKNKQTQERHEARKKLWSHLTGETGYARFGFKIVAPEKLTEDPGADDLDAFICAVQAAWGWRHRDENYGAPSDVDRLEGWITDPLLSKGTIC